MPAYAIGRLRSKNWSWLKEYGPVTAALIEKHGGRYLARGGEVQRLEGAEETPDADVLLEFARRSVEGRTARVNRQDAVDFLRGEGRSTRLLLRGGEPPPKCVPCSAVPRPPLR